jgi:hypothetical protein
MSPMTTDSQIGVPRSTGFRRTEKSTAPNLVGIFTDHFVAKIVALLLAAVLVVLIDRELEDTLLDSDFDVRVGSVNQADAASAARRQLVLETEPGIAVRFFKPERVHVTIKGQQKLLEAAKKVYVARVPIRADWLRVDVGGDKHSISRAILGSDVRVGIPGVEITIDPPIQLDLDPEVEHLVPLRAAAKDVAPGLLAEVSFEPESVRVQGPETLFPMESITIAIPTAGRTSEFTYAVTSLPEEVLLKHVRLAPEQRIVARVRFTKGASATLDVKDIPIRRMASFGDGYRPSLVGLPKETVTAKFAGTPEAVAYWGANQEELRKLLVAIVDTDKLASKVTPQAGAPASDYADVEIYKIPLDLKLVSKTPAQVEVSVIKN